MSKVYKFSFLIVLLIFVESISAQQNTSSPYSRFGLGDLTNQFSPVFNSLGGGGYAIYNENIINPYSPASYSAFSPNSFIFSTGLNHNVLNIQSLSDEQTVNNVSLSHIVFAFPLSKRIGTSFGVIPFSNIGYTLESRDQQYEADMLYSGDGGLSKVYLGTALKVLSVLHL